MAYTLEDLENVKAAIKSGARRVKFSDREVEYRSLTELRSVAEEIRRELGLSESNLNLSYFEVHKDLD